VFRLISAFFNDHKGVRRLSKGVLLSLVIFASWRVFMNMPEVNTAVAACYATLVGAAGTAIWKYMDGRSKENE
jgi:hypothetical protein